VKARAFRKGVSEVPPTLSGTYCTVVARAIFTKQQPHKASKQSKHLAQGIDFDYYEGPWQDLMLRLKDLTPTKHGNVPSLLDVTAREPNRYFAFRYNVGGWTKEAASEDGLKPPKTVSIPSTPPTQCTAETSRIAKQVTTCASRSTR
jgi:hypothetical protein